MIELIKGCSMKLGRSISSLILILSVAVAALMIAACEQNKVNSDIVESDSSVIESTVSLSDFTVASSPVENEIITTTASTEITDKTTMVSSQATVLSSTTTKDAEAIDTNVLIENTPETTQTSLAVNTPNPTPTPIPPTSTPQPADVQSNSTPAPEPPPPETFPELLGYNIQLKVYYQDENGYGEDTVDFPEMVPVDEDGVLITDIISTYVASNYPPGSAWLVLDNRVPVWK